MTPEQARQLATLRDQQSAITQALAAMAEARWTGEGSVEAFLLALNPTWQGQLSPVPPMYELPDSDIEPPSPVWVPSPNCWYGHDGYEVVAIVVHTMAGTLGSCDSWFANPASQVSSHYGIGLSGEQHQYVALANSSWANGILEPGNTWQGQLGLDGNPNWQTITIETEDNGSGATPVTDEQYESTLECAALACATFPSIRYLLRHTDISPSSRPQCCGDRWVASGRFTMLAEDLELETTL